MLAASGKHGDPETLPETPAAGQCMPSESLHTQLQSKPTVAPTMPS